ncbi:MAG: hypothetical protein AAF989_07830 [Planctomycetota bacterium]
MSDLSPELIRPPEAFDTNAQSLTAAGAALASLLIVPFGLACWWAFPRGGILVSGLGVALGIAGMSSRFTRESIAIALIHLAALVACWTKSAG